MIMVKGLRTVVGVFVVGVLYLASSTRRTLHTLNPWTSDREFTSRFRTSDDVVVQSVLPSDEVDVDAPTANDPSQQCQELYTNKYLDNFLETQLSFCTNSSRSRVSCFQNVIADDGRKDMLCYATAARFDPTSRRFGLDCEEPSFPSDDLEGTPYELDPLLSQLTSYWYETGPLAVFEEAIDVGINDHVQQTQNNAILLKREGSGNLWHCLMEVMSLSWTLDILELAKDIASDNPMLGPIDMSNTRILVLDEHSDGPFFGLWDTFGARSVERIRSLPPNVSYDNLIVPLAGASNPLWLGDWQPKSCGQSALVEKFRDRILSFYGLKSSPSITKTLNVLYIDRKDSRRLQNSTEFLAMLQTRMPNVQVNSVDMASLPFREQLEMITNTDVLLGVHGAGLTHSMFLPTGSAVVEILPHDLPHMGFRNLADLIGHRYFSAHALEKEEKFLPLGASPEDLIEFPDWHDVDVHMNEAEFLDLMTAAIMSVSP